MDTTEGTKTLTVHVDPNTICYFPSMKSAVFLSVCISHLLVLTGVSQEIDDPRFEQILQAIRTLNDGANRSQQKRITQYLEDLEKLEKTVQKTGDLDKVLQIAREREAWGKGKPTPAINPKDSSVLLDLRKLRYYFDQDLAKLTAVEMEKTEQEKDALIAKLEELVVTLTTEGKIQEALLVRQVKEKLVAGTFTPPERSSPSPAPAEPQPVMKPAEEKEDPLVGTRWQAINPGFYIVEFRLEASGQLHCIGKDGRTFEGEYVLKDQRITLNAKPLKGAVLSVTPTELVLPSSKKAIWRRMPDAPSQ